MKKNNLIYLLIIIIIIWLAILSGSLSSRNANANENVINQYEVNGISTDFTEVVREALPSVVTINADGKISSGFVYEQQDDRVYILCSYHGVSDSSNINVTFGSSYSENAALIGHDVYCDLAVLLLESPYTIQPLKLGDATQLKPGEFVISIGTPVSADYAGSAALSMVSLADLTIENTIEVNEERLTYDLNVIQLSDALPEGYSGSPVINMLGEAVGMDLMTASGNISFALSANEIRIIADQLITSGSVLRNDLGLRGSFIRDMYNYEKSNLNIPLDVINGIYVQKVADDSLAYQAGVRPGDVVEAINDKEITSLNDYLEILHSEAETFTFSYSRMGEEINQVSTLD